MWFLYTNMLYTEYNRNMQTHFFTTVIQLFLLWKMCTVLHLLATNAVFVITRCHDPRLQKLQRWSAKSVHHKPYDVGCELFILFSSSVLLYKMSAIFVAQRGGLDMDFILISDRLTLVGSSLICENRDLPHERLW